MLFENNTFFRRFAICAFWIGIAWCDWLWFRQHFCVFSETLACTCCFTFGLAWWDLVHRSVLLRTLLREGLSFDSLASEYAIATACFCGLPASISRFTFVEKPFLVLALEPFTNVIISCCKNNTVGILRSTRNTHRFNYISDRHGKTQQYRIRNLQIIHVSGKRDATTKCIRAAILHIPRG